MSLMPKKSMKLRDYKNRVEKDKKRHDLKKPYLVEEFVCLKVLGQYWVQ